MTRLQDLLCLDDQRRELLRANDTLHGIDFLEVKVEPPADNQLVLEVHFVAKQNPAGTADLVSMLNDLDGHPELFNLSGGVRIRTARIVAATRTALTMVLRTSEAGDFSPYVLRARHPRLDPVFSFVEFSFKAGCPTVFDCKPGTACDALNLPVEPVDYMSKDYASFRQALLDRLAVVTPNWHERNPADLGIAIAELLAYTADHLSYYQDAVAGEAFLETARQRISVRRHARLIDYRIHDGASARTFIALAANAAGVLPAGTQFLTTLTEPVRGKLPPFPAVIPPEDSSAAATAAEAVFECEYDAPIHPSLSSIDLHDWGRAGCCLPAGSTSADLKGDLSSWLRQGGLLLLEEVKGPSTGLVQDADTQKRHVVRLTSVMLLSDPLLSQTVTRVSWDSADALPFPLCISSVDETGSTVTGVSKACGNIVLVHHGRTKTTSITAANAESYRYFRFMLEDGPISHWSRTSPFEPATSIISKGPETARAEVQIEGWISAETLLDSDPADRHFVVETDNRGQALVRFGDGVSGRRPVEGEVLLVRYRTGETGLGRIASGAITHIVNPGNLADWPGVTAIRNPLPSAGATERQSLDEVKLTAPATLSTGLFRAVTEEDYARAAELLPEVSKAVATFRWTGFWHTVFIAIDPAGGTDLPSEAAARVEAFLRKYLQLGYDLRLEAPLYVPLDIRVEVCVDSRHFRSDVNQALLRELGTGVLSGGRKAFFHPDQFTFGQPLHLSALYSAVTGVEGVRSANVTKFQRLGRSPSGELSRGAITVGRREILRLDSDPSFAERGVLVLKMEGGK